MAIDMDMVSRNRFQQQMQIVEDQVNLLHQCGSQCTNIESSVLLE